MLIRALIVVLAILNAGVALWWWRSPSVSDAPVPAMSPPDGVPVLQLRAEQVDPALPSAALATEQPAPEPAPASIAAAAAVPATVETPLPLAAAQVVPAQPAAVCVSLGPFAERALLDQARSKAGEALAAVRVRELQAAGNASYRVMLPPAGSREAAQATVKRIVAAGISDYFIIGQGELANAVALGQFRNRDGAQRRLDQLLEAGFPAQIVPSEAATARWWLDARLAAGTSATQVRQASGSERVQSLDCKVFALD